MADSDSSESVEGAALDRRAFVSAAGAVAALAATAAPAAAQAPHKVPIIDTHIHLFDPKRPQGAPYTGPRGSDSNTLGAFPDRYAKLARPLGVVGAICVEASPWVEDNLWVLETIQKNNIMVGFTGNLKLEQAEFKEYLERYAKNPLFRGIRYGNLFGYSLAEQSKNPDSIAKLKDLAAADRVLEVANPRMDLLQGVIRVSDAVPNLRIIVNHLPNFVPTPEIQAEYDAVLKEFTARKQIYVKLSEVIRRAGGGPRGGGPPAPGAPPPPPPPPADVTLAPYKPRLDQIYAAFGEDRVIFGSDWPNSDGVTTVDNIFRVVKEYFATKSKAQAEKYFWRNSIAAYKWIKRASDQPTAT